MKGGGNDGLAGMVQPEASYRGPTARVAVSRGGSRLATIMAVMHSNEDYDRRVRTFIPGYDHLLNAAAAACGVALAGVKRPVILDLGTGTGALSARCLDALPSASIVGVDSDPEILQIARKRLGRRPNAVTLVPGDLAKLRIPAVDAVVATLALHHVATPALKRALYKRCFGALPSGGVVISGDFHPSSIDAFARQQAHGWTSHLLQSVLAGRSAPILPGVGRGRHLHDARNRAGDPAGRRVRGGRHVAARGIRGDRGRPAVTDL